MLFWKADDPEGYLKVGERLTVVRPINLHPYTLVHCGERATVEYVELGTFYAELKLDRVHPGLRYYGNCMWIILPDMWSELRSLKRERKIECLRPSDLLRQSG